MEFSKEDDEIGKVSDKYCKHDIKFRIDKPIKQRPFNIQYAKQKIVEQCFEKMLKMGILEHSNSEWASPIDLVKKPDGSKRFCVNHQKGNN